MLGRMNPEAEVSYNNDLLIRFILCWEETPCSEACHSSLRKEQGASSFNTHEPKTHFREVSGPFVMCSSEFASRLKEWIWPSLY